MTTPHAYPSAEPNPSGDFDQSEPASYADAQGELEQILERLNADEVDVDQLALEVQRGAFLISWSRARIAGAQLAIERTVSELEAGTSARPGPPTRGRSAPAATARRAHDADSDAGPNNGVDGAGFSGTADDAGPEDAGPDDAGPDDDSLLGRPSELFDDEPF